MTRSDTLDRHSLARVAWIPLLLLAIVRVSIFLFSGTPGQFGIFRDELYYLACADHLALGYVDQPPLSILVLAANRALLGDSLLAIRLLPALLSGVWLIAVGLLARELGGNRPTLEFMDNAMRHKFVDRSLLDLLAGMVLNMHPLALPLWVGGLFALVFYRPLRPWRPLAWVFVTVLAILGLSGSAKPEYLAPAIPLLLAAGAVALVTLCGSRARWLPAAYAALLGVAALPLVPFAIPVLDEDRYVAYAEAMGVAPSTDERKELGPLPQHFADRHGWRDLAQTVAEAYQALSPDEQVSSAVLVENYGEAGAIDYYRKQLPLPPVYSGHNNYDLWRPPERTPRVWIILGIEQDDLADECTSIEKVGEVDNPWSMPYERHRWVRVCRDPLRSVREIWPELKNFS